MNVRPLVAFISIGLAAWSAAGQNVPPAQEPPAVATPAAEAPPEKPPDIKAHSAAAAVTDPAARIGALEKFKRDFPHSELIRTANLEILSLLVKKFPDQAARIRKQAKTTLADAERDQKGRVASQIADTLLEGGILLDTAESYAKKGVDSLRQVEYLAEQRAGYADREVKPPSEEELLKRFREVRAPRLGTLGRVYVKEGQIAKGQKLLEESYSASPGQPLVASALGILAAKAGNGTRALEYLVTARLSGKSTPEANAALEAVYRKINNGSLEGLDNMLDREYRSRFPSPIKAEKYQRVEKRGGRVVLVELFAGAGCPPCAGADVAFDAVLERYARQDVAAVVYHQHIPRPDPISNPGTQARFKFYNGRGVPAYRIDGQDPGSNGGSREQAKGVFAKVEPQIDKELESAAEASLKLEAAIDGGTVTVKVRAGGVKSESKDLKVQVVLVEKELRYTGENGIRFHPMAVRAMGGKDAGGFALDPGAPAVFEQVFDIEKISAALKKHLDEYEAGGHRGEAFRFIEKKYEIDRGNLAVVAFVQDNKTRHVLQAAWTDLAPAGRSETEN